MVSNDKKILIDSKYQYGQKRCLMCSIFMVIFGISCPCCNTLFCEQNQVENNTADNYSAFRYF